jgi:hypothetical protein
VSATGDRAALEHAYQETIYRVYLPRGATIDLQVGLHSAAIDALSRRTGARWWTCMTAWNPGSRLLPAWRNRNRQRALQARLERELTATAGGRALVLPAAGVPSSSQDWLPEESLFVAGLPPTRTLRLARAFGQNAVLAGRRGAPARLIWVRRPGLTV